jgi:Protein of unknown function (DUF3592)
MIYHSLLQVGIYVILIVGFAFVGMVLIKPFFVRKQILQKGVIVEGCIIEHRRQLVLDKTGWHHDHYLTYSYEYQGTSYTLEKFVSEGTYQAYPDGTKISVRCMPDDPTKVAAVDFYF